MIYTGRCAIYPESETLTYSLFLGIDPFQYIWFSLTVYGEFVGNVANQ